MNEVVELAARAASEAFVETNHLRHLVDGSATRDSTQAAWHAVARAVIESLRDNLTDGMGEIIAKHARCCGGIAHTIWVEACDEALKP